MAGDGRNLDQNTVALTSGGKTSRLLKSGDIIGDSYRLKGLIGRGGMGYVFRAEHIMISQDYALKMLAPDQINEVTWGRFQAEGKVIAKLDHANIVKIYNMGVDRGDYPYYVMDLLDGVALSDCIKDKMSFTIDEILNIFIQVASGLGYAHSHGIIHRDIKPSNVVLVDSGGQYPTAKIVDFGIAKLVGAADLHNQSLTATGEIFGSPYYMSPEQCLGAKVDHRSDIYSLGCTLFEVLCGRPPFLGESALQTVMMHQNKPSPTIESLSGKFSSAEMEALVAKMLMKRPADRYQSMDQLMHDLERIRGHKAVDKNADTGFKRAMDRRLEAMGSKYAEGEQKQARRKKMLIVIAVPVVGLAAAAVAGVLMQAARLIAKTPPAALQANIPTSKEFDAAGAPCRKEMAVLAEKVSLVKPIASTIDRAKRSRVFHCPAVEIGLLAWWDRTIDCMGGLSHTFITGQTDACGEARVPADRPILLVVNAVLNRDTFMCPEILAKFGPAELFGLDLIAPVAIDDLGTEDVQKLAKEQTLALVKAISGWTNCQYFEFFNVPATDEALIELDKHKTLRRFALHGSDVNPNTLAQRKFLPRLTALELGDMPDCNPALRALRGSASITSISLEKCCLSASGLNVLAGCHNLRCLELTDCPLDYSALEAIGTIKSLKQLKLIGCELKPEHLPVLGKLGFIPHIYLDLLKWPKPVRQELFKLLPNAKGEWHGLEMKPSE
jgi:tRNA A-37 threonylcarbamoyl transferase component Bud32